MWINYCNILKKNNTMSPCKIALMWLYLCCLAIFMSSAKTLHPRTVASYIRKEVQTKTGNFSQHLARSGRSQDLEVTESFRWKLGTSEGTAASSFRSLGQSFLFSDQHLYLVKLNASFSPVLEEVFNINPSSKIIFIESVEWRNVLFLLIAFEDGTLHLFRITDKMAHSQQKLSCCNEPSTCVPKAAGFFIQDGQLYLALISDNPGASPMILYQWKTADWDRLDEMNNLLDPEQLTSPTALATFPTKSGTAIVVARYNELTSKGGLTIYLMRRKSLKLVQVVDVDGVLGILPFVYESKQHLLVLTSEPPSLLYAWNGKQLTSKTPVPNVFKIRMGSVSYINGFTFLLLSERNYVRIFRTNGLSLIHEKTFDLFGQVHSATIHENKDGVFLIAISSGKSGLTPYVIKLQLDLVGEKEKLVLPPDDLTKCLNDLNLDLTTRAVELDKLLAARPNLVLKHQAGSISGKLVVNSPHKVVLRKGTQASIVINPQDYNLTATPSQLQNEINAKFHTAEAVLASLPGLAKKAAPLAWRAPRPLKLASLKARNAFIEAPVVNTLNTRPFIPENILRYSRNQTFTGKISAREVKVDKVFVKTLSGMKVEDLLLDSGVQQSVAVTEVPSVTAGSVNVLSGEINGIPLNNVVRNNIPAGTVIRGLKTAPSLAVNNLDIVNYNKVDLTNWWNAIRPDIGHEAQRQTHIKSDLIVKNLTVNYVNSVELMKLVASLFVRGKDQQIRGTVAFTKTPTIVNLSSKNIFGKPSSNLMTLSSDQVFNGAVSVGALSAHQINTNYVNKLNLATDVARLDSPTVFTGYAAFQNLIINELHLPLNTYVGGNLLPSNFLQEQRQVYKQPVRVRGTLQVVDLGLQVGQFVMQGQTLSISNLPSIFWTKTTAQEIPIPVSVKYPLQAKSISVNYVNALAPVNILHCDTLQKLAVPWLVPSAMVVGNVEHLPGSRPAPLNPLALSRSVVQAYGNYTIRGTKVFTGGIEVGHLWVNLLDNKDPNNVLRKEGSVIPGSNTWNKIHIEKDLVIELDLFPSKVNNLDLCAIVSKAVKTDEPATLKTVVMNTLEADKMSLGVLNSVSLRNRNRRSVNSQLKRLLVKGRVTVPALHYVEVVNKIKLREFLPFVVNKTTGAYIGGRKTLEAQVIIQQSLTTTKVNDVDLTTVTANLLSRTKPQNVTAHYTVASAEASRVEAYDINGIDVGKLFTVGSSQQIFSNLRFLGGLRIGVLTVGSLPKGCDIKKVISSLNVLGGRRWNSLEIEGNLTWSVTRSPKTLAERGLGYLLGSAVTVSGDHTIVGETTFGGPVSVVDIKSDRHIDDIDLEAIKNDSLMKNSPVDQVISSPVRFLSDIKASSLIVTGNIDVAIVNNNTIADLDRLIVRKSRNTGPVRGKKVFLNGIVASTTYCDSLLNDMVISSIVTYDMPRLPPLVLNTKMTIVQNLTFTSFNDLNVMQLLEERVTLDTPQTITGSITFVDDLVITDEALVSNINNVDVSTVVTTDSPLTQTIVGPKIFIQDLMVEGPMTLRYLNSLNFSQAIFEALLKDLPSRIAGSVTFAVPIAVDSDLTIDGTMNGITLEELQRLLKTKTLKYPKGALDRLFKELKLGNGLLSARRNPEEVLYLDSVKNLDIRVSDMNRAVATPSNGGIRLDVYGSDTSRQCGLPEGCACPVQMTLDLSEQDGKLAAGTWAKLNERTFVFEVSNTIVTVVTNSASRDQICRVSPEERQRELTTVSWYRPSAGPSGYQQTSLSAGFHGYVSDATVFQYGEIIYVVVGLSYDAIYDTNTVFSKVLQLDPVRNTISLAQEILTHGVSALNAFSVSSVPFLVVGNTYDSVKRSSQVPLQIYKFNSTTYKLDIVKKVPTVGVVAVASLVDGPNAIIVVAQAQTNAPVLVFEYDSLYNSFKVIQQLTNTALPTGLGSFRVSDGFVGLSTADDTFRLYKYCDVQGLKLVQEYRKTGVRGFARFDLDKHYLFLTSSEESSLVELVVQGR